MKRKYILLILMLITNYQTTVYSMQKQKETYVNGEGFFDGALIGGAIAEFGTLMLTGGAFVPGAAAGVIGAVAFGALVEKACQDAERDNEKQRKIEQKDRENKEKGITPLHIACFHHDITPIRRLIQSGAPLNAQRNDDGNAPLHHACWFSESGAIELIRAGADVNIQNNDGCTPLHKAVFMSRKKIVEELLAHGANPNIPTRLYNKNPLDEALGTTIKNTAASRAIIAMLIDKGAHTYSKFHSPLHYPTDNQSIFNKDLYRYAGQLLAKQEEEKNQQRLLKELVSGQKKLLAIEAEKVKQAESIRQELLKIEQQKLSRMSGVKQELMRIAVSLQQENATLQALYNQVQALKSGQGSQIQPTARRRGSIVVATRAAHTNMEKFIEQLKRESDELTKKINTTIDEFLSSV